MAAARPAASPPAAKRTPIRVVWLKPLVFLAMAAPLVWLISAAFLNQLGPNPAEALIRGTGDWTLRALCLTLCVTPLRVLSAWPHWARIRRMLGLWTFAYASLHLLAFAWLDMDLDTDAIAKDILKRPFILVGTLAWLLMLPLALTSFNRAIRALGAPRWQALHRAVYAVALLGVIHFLWMRASKQNFAEVVVYGAIVALLLGWRLWRRLRSPSRGALMSR
jgi:methionine sulfoxide reductase heme-binding subunit